MRAASRLVLGYPPPGASDPLWANVVLACHMNGANNGTTFTDQKGKTVTANNGAVTSTAQSMFNGSSGYFDADASLSVAASADFAFTGDFTQEAFVRLANVTGYHPIFDQYYNTTGGYQFTTYGTELQFWFYGSLQATTSAAGLTANSWTHIALERYGSGVSIYVGGAYKGGFSSSAQIGVSGSDYSFGKQSSGTASYLDGYAGELRITKGVARYQGPFMPPSAAFPNS